MTASAPLDSFATVTGTTMAAPMLAGSVGLIWSKVDDLKGKFHKTLDLFKETAFKVNSSECGNFGSPNQ